MTLGCSSFGRAVDAQLATELVSVAIEEGIASFDTADIYGTRPGDSEQILGAALSGRREGVVLATKFGWDLGDPSLPGDGARGSRTYVRAAVEASLRRLRTDYIDLYQYHYPDPTTPVQETLEALTELVGEGKVRYIGVSLFDAWQLADAHWLSTTHHLEHFVTVQCAYSLVNRRAESELAPACRHFGVGLLPFYPLGQGLLTGKYRKEGAPPAEARLSSGSYTLPGASWEAIRGAVPWALIGALEQFGAARGRSLVDVAVAGLGSRDVVASVLAGATSRSQVRSNAAAGRWRLTEEDRRDLQAVLDAHQGSDGVDQRLFDWRPLGLGPGQGGEAGRRG